MEKLYELILDILGKRDDSPEFIKLTSLRKPSKIYDAEGSIIYEFSSLGFGMAYDQARTKFWMAGFEFGTKPVKDGTMLPFPENLHLGISNSDGPNEIERKLGVKAVSFRSLGGDSRYRGRYKLPPYTFECVFSSQTGPLQGMTIYLDESQQRPT